MNCNKCNDYNPCKQKSCGCPVKELYTNCINVGLGVLPCSGINADDTLDNVLLGLEQFICDKVDSVASSIQITNIGTGAGIYAGDNVIGTKQLRTLTSTDNSITLLQTPDTIDLSVTDTGVENLGDLADVVLTDDVTGDILIKEGNVWINQNIGDVAGISNIGSGIPLVIGKNVRTLVSLDDSVNISSTTDTVNIEVPMLDVSTAGYTPTYLGYSSNNHRFAGITSSSLEITTNTEGNITIESTPDFADEGVPRFIVNNLYTGAEESGTISKPFKTIQNAVDAFVGTGTAESPQYQNGVIMIQKGNTYNYNGHFTYRNINVVFEEGVTMVHQPVGGGWLYDGDSLDGNSNTSTNITIRTGSEVILMQNGFRNKGSLNTETGSKFLNIDGAGRITGGGTYSDLRAVVESNFDNVPNYTNNSFGPSIGISGIRIESRIPIWKIGGSTSVAFDDTLLRIANNGPATNVFMNQSGGTIYLTNSTVGVTNYLASSDVDSIFYVTKDSVGFIPNFEGTNNRFQTDSATTNLFKVSDPNNLQDTLQPQINCIKNTTRFSKFSKLFESATVLSDVSFKYNIFETGVVGDVDLTKGNTISVQNIIGDNVVESLVSYADSSAAQTAGLYSGCKFINTTTSTVDIVI